MRALIAAISFALTIVIFQSPAEAKRHTAKPTLSASEVVKLKQELASVGQELRGLRDILRVQPPSVVGAFASVPIPFLELKPPIVLASLGPSDVKVDPLAKEQTLRGVPSARLPDPLKAMLHRVQDACDGFRVISACRPGARVRGSGRVSLHASCRAADITMSRYSCAYPILAKSPCGYSTDPGRVNHIHVSCSPGTREYGRKFAHWQPSHRRYARRHGRHYARV